MHWRESMKNVLVTGGAGYIGGTVATLLRGKDYQSSDGAGQSVPRSSGTLAAVIHHGLTLPVGTLAGIH
jgi:hypothetical protein